MLDREPRSFLERAAGIEPASLAWKARVLPLHNARSATGEVKPPDAPVKLPSEDEVCIVEIGEYEAVRRRAPGTPPTTCTRQELLYRYGFAQ